MSDKPSRERGPIEIHSVHRGAYFDWSQSNCGFGQLAFSQHDGRLECHSECMGREWVRARVAALEAQVSLLAAQVALRQPPIDPGVMPTTQDRVVWFHPLGQPTTAPVWPSNPCEITCATNGDQ